jgi:hypothetical protein
MSRVKFHQGCVPGLRANAAGRSGDPARRGVEGTLELTEAPRLKTAAKEFQKDSAPPRPQGSLRMSRAQVEPWRTCQAGYPLTGTAYGVGVVSGVGIVAVVGGAVPFLNGRSSSE